MGFFSAAMRTLFFGLLTAEAEEKPIYLSGQARVKVKWIMGRCRELDAGEIKRELPHP
jgi:hypothetical protein